MANQLKDPKNTSQNETPKADGKGIFSMISTTFRLDGVFDDGVPIQYMPKIIWVVVLIILYIANAHYTEKTVRKIDALKFEVEELRTEFTTLKASYMFESKQSEVAKKMATYGLVESKNPPLKVDGNVE